ncbi:hypothetical protein QP185_22440, partial [Sphingomonas aerolata]|uniref:hypothetical protein n=1 Tax=Sphingomonas aerolata TaxID=185951 RepID=UPI002FE3386B
DAYGTHLKRRAHPSLSHTTISRAGIQKLSFTNYSRFFYEQASPRLTRANAQALHPDDRRQEKS